MKNENEMFVPRKNEAEAVELLRTLGTMSEEEQRQMLSFLAGVALGRRMSTNPAA